MRKALGKHLSDEVPYLTVRFFNRQRKMSIKLEWRDLANAAAFACLRETGFLQRAEVHVTWAGPRLIRQMNRTHRQMDRVTDVLSFPGLTWQDGTAILEPGDMDPETGELFLGDLVVCLQQMQDQARTYGHSEQRELAFLVAHGTLHLLGWDHQNPDESTRMFALQETILVRMGLTREGPV